MLPANTGGQTRVRAFLRDANGDRELILNADNDPRSIYVVDGTGRARIEGETSGWERVEGGGWRGWNMPPAVVPSNARFLGVIEYDQSHPRSLVFRRELDPSASQ